MMTRQASRIILFYLSVRVVCCIPLNQFYPYGPYAAEATSKIDKGNDAFSPVIFTQKSFYFFGQQRQSVIVSVNGALSFFKLAPEFTSDPFPLGNNREIIAPFWADVDTSRRGNVWYHESSDPNFLKRASDEILKVYPETNFAAESLFIATWEQVGYYNAAATKTNTFQCVLATDGIQSYAIFLYADEEIQWTTGDADGGINGLGGIPAQVGFNKGDGIGFTTINNSRTERIIKVASASNTDLPGMLVFKISDENIFIKNLNFISDDNGDNDNELDATLNVIAVAEYYLSFFENYNGGRPSISIITTDAQPVSYLIEAPGLGVHHNGTVTADNESTVQLPSTAVVLSHVEQNKGIYLKTSSDSVTVIGRNLYNGYTADTFLALPIIKLSDSTYIYFGIASPQYRDSDEPQYAVLIVGTEDSTVMKLKVTQSVTISVGSTTTNLIPGNEYSFMINRLQTVSFQSEEDLSGTKIVTNKPVSVYSGHDCAYIPNDFSIGGCDNIIEQIPPTTFWGKVHYVTPLSSRRLYSIRILAAHDSTSIDVYCNNSLKSSYTIDEGKYIDITLDLQEYCAIISNKEVLVAQFAHGLDNDETRGDPMMMLLLPTIQYNYRFKFSTLLSTIVPLNEHKHYVDVIVLAQYYQPDEIYLITGGVSTSLNMQTWIPVKVNNSIVAYATHVNIPEGVAEVTHNNKAALMTTVVYGFAWAEGYGHPGGYYANRNRISGPPPYFTMSPSNQTIELSTNNHNVTLSCKANNTLSYIWDRQNSGIPSGAIGRNTNTLILINVQPKDSGSYRCVATNNYGTNMSDYATVIIKNGPCEVTSISGVVGVDGNVVTITFSTSDSAAEFQCKLDNEMLSLCSSPNTWRNVNSGEHSITVVARCPGQKKTLEKIFTFQIP